MGMGSGLELLNVPARILTTLCSLGEGRGKSVATVASTCTMSSGAWKGSTRIWGLQCPHDHSPALFFLSAPMIWVFQVLL